MLDIYASFKNFEAIPKIYPKNISNKNARLFPFVVLARYDLITFIGHETPNDTIMMISKISDIKFTLNQSITLCLRLYDNLLQSN